MLAVLTIEAPGTAEATTGTGIRTAPPVRMKLPVRRDTVVSAAKGERDANLGGSRRLKTKGIVELSLFDIAAERLAGALLKDAVLHVRKVGEEPQLRVTVSSVGAHWVEGTSDGYRPQPGSASFDRAGETAWAWAGSDVTAVINGMGGSIWAFSDPTPPDREGWQRIAIDERVLAARVAGLSGGFALTDDVGSEYARVDGEFEYRIFPNRTFASREAGPEMAPFVTVSVAGHDGEPPGAVRPRQIEDPSLGPGQAAVLLEPPADRGGAGTLGFDVRWSFEPEAAWEAAQVVPRYLIPLVGPSDDPVHIVLRDLDASPGEEIWLAVRAVDAAGNRGAIVEVPVRLQEAPESVPWEAPAPASSSGGASPPRLGDGAVSVVDPLDKVHPQSGEMIPPRPEDYRSTNHLWDASARRVSLHAARNEFVAFQVVVESETPPAARLRFDPEEGCRPEAELLRPVPIPSEAGLLPDPLVGLGSPIGGPEVRFQSLLVDLFVPHDCPPGALRGVLELREGEQTIELQVDLRVWNFTLPDSLSFVPQMNSYGLPRPPEDLGYYRLAHRHRTVLNMLPYSWRGEVFRGYRAPSDGGGWSAWDERFGPLLDGTAFSDLPRAGIPVDAFYLPFNENWPVPVDGHFDGGYWIERALSSDYRRRFVEMVEAWARHFDERGWTDTFFEFYLNNKLYHRREGWERSSAYWVFDEPINTQDFWALRWYAEAFHEGVSRSLVASDRAAPKMAFRADVSRPQWQRDLLDGLLDVNVVGVGFPRYLRTVMERRGRNGEVVVNYGTTNRVEESNVQPAAWVLWAWSVGADGVLPWKTVGKESSWRKASPLALFYPGPDGDPGPHPSVRLKAYRRGQQDVEYLTLLSLASGEPRASIGSRVLEDLGLWAEVFQEGSRDAGRLVFAGTDCRDLWRLRQRVGATLDRLAPPPARRLVELRTPARAPDGVPRPKILEPPRAYQVIE